MKPKSLGDYNDTVSIWGGDGEGSETHVGTPGEPMRHADFPASQVHGYSPSFPGPNSPNKRERKV